MKFLHTMIRVNNLEESLDFFCNKLGLIETRRKDVPEGKFTLIFLAATEDEGSAINTRSPEIELTHNWDYEDLDKGRNFGHLAFSVPNIYETCQKLRIKTWLSIDHLGMEEWLSLNLQIIFQLNFFNKEKH